ncbi:GcrA family cell cycle regulator, partial [Oharaeibacter diazotrophicus]
MSWTDERVERLKTLWAEGLSASQIAAELGSVTRNAVIGKVHRLGLSGRAKPQVQAARPAAAAAAAPRVKSPA